MSRPEYAAARKRGIESSARSRQRLYPHYIPRIRQQREDGLTWKQSGKSGGVTGAAACQFFRNHGG